MGAWLTGKIRIFRLTYLYLSLPTEVHWWVSIWVGPRVLTLVLCLEVSVTQQTPIFYLSKKTYIYISLKGFKKSPPHINIVVILSLQSHPTILSGWQWQLQRLKSNVFIEISLSLSLSLSPYYAVPYNLYRVRHNMGYKTMQCKRYNCQKYRN